MEENSKEDVYFKICNAILRLEVEKGHLLWKISDIARYSNVTRSLIYYYFGKERETILEEAYRYMLEVIFDHDKGNNPTIHQRIKNAINKIKEMPYLFVLFFLERKRDTDIGNLIRESEKKLLLRIKSEYPELSDFQVNKLYMIELGAVVFQDISDEDIGQLFKPIL